MSPKKRTTRRSKQAGEGAEEPMDQGTEGAMEGNLLTVLKGEVDGEEGSEGDEEAATLAKEGNADDVETVESSLVTAAAKRASDSKEEEENSAEPPMKKAKDSRSSSEDKESPADGDRPQEEAVTGNMVDEVASTANDDESKESTGEQDSSGAAEVAVKVAKPDEEQEEEEGKKVEAKQQAEVKENKRSPELTKFWKTVEDDPTDFTGWTYLLQHVDASCDIDSAREAYDAFLFRYPYCYGYWKKYADLEKRKGTSQKCMMVFERGIKAIPLSVDLWIHYLNHIKKEYEDQPEFVRAQYERAVGACGREWRSDKLWDHYVKWENAQKPKDSLTGSKVLVLKLYDRILVNQTQGLSHQFSMFRDFVKENNPKEMLMVEEFLAVRKEVLDSLAKSKKQDETKKEDKEDKEDAEEAPGENEAAISTDEENQAIRERIIMDRKKAFKETEEKLHQRWTFEDNIKRPYFHMKPLERGQLRNWNDYLDFEMNKDEKDETAIEVLFERCLIACALYEEFWLKYVKWLDTLEMTPARIEMARDVHRRACVHHLPNKVNIHLAWSAFEERHGDCEMAAEILVGMEKLHPQMMSVMLRRVNLERRRNRIDEVHMIYAKSIAEAKTVQLGSELSIKYSRFLRLGLDEREKAIKVLSDATLKDEGNAKLYLQLLDIHLHHQPLDRCQVVSIFDRVLSAKVATTDADDGVKGKKPLFPLKQRLVFSQRKLDFLEDFGSDIAEVLKADEEYNKLKAELTPSDTAAASGDSQASGAGIKTIEGRGGHKKTNGAVNSPLGSFGAPPGPGTAYGAQQADGYQQYGSRYASQYPASAYGQQQTYANYYQQYGSAGYGGYGYQ